MAVLMAFILLFVRTPSIQAERSENTELATIETAVVEQTMESRSESGSNDSSYSVITLSNDNNGDVSQGEKAIRIIEREGDLIKATTILPYKIGEDGHLINSFQFAFEQSQLRTIQPVVTNFVDVSITVSHTYSEEYSYYNWARFYRHVFVEAYWSSNNSSATATGLYVLYDSAGDLYSYPNCITQDMSSCFIQSDYYIASSIDQSYPVKDYVYGDYDHYMNTNRRLYFSDYFSHGGVIYLLFNYSVNGHSYSHDRSYHVYGK
ncbi:MAG: hypothetical protein IJM90_05815 [Firmicutes bacterium]|nr:hypothetical protein [Bacillota bacterium]